MGVYSSYARPWPPSCCARYLVRRGQCQNLSLFRGNGSDVLHSLRFQFPVLLQRGAGGYGFMASVTLSR
jgi:hypothetical protein